MDKRQQLVSELVDLSNEIEWFNRPLLEKELKEYSLSEIALIEKIELISHANVTKLAAASYMTRGAISKQTKKLLASGLIESYQLNDNKKEVYFRLTLAGKEMNQIHQKLHEDFLKRDQQVFEGMSSSEYDSVFRFIGKYREHLKRIAEK